MNNYFHFTTENTNFAFQTVANKYKYFLNKCKITI